jgi:hypothetical protein
MDDFQSTELRAVGPPARKEAGVYCSMPATP